MQVSWKKKVIFLKKYEHFSQKTYIYISYQPWTTMAKYEGEAESISRLYLQP